MKYSTLIGLVLLAVGLVLYIVNEPDYMESEFYIAAFLGLGLGLLLGGFMGFAQKKRKKVVISKEAEKPVEPVKTTQPETNETDDSGLKL